MKKFLVFMKILLATLFSLLIIPFIFALDDICHLSTLEYDLLFYLFAPLFFSPLIIVSFHEKMKKADKEFNNCVAISMDKSGEVHLVDEKDREKLNRILTMGGTNSGKCRKKIDKDYCKKLLHQLDTCTSNPSNEHYVVVKEDIYIFKEALMSLIREIN